MNKKEVIEKCIQLIEQNYYFIGNQRAEWDKDKTRILSEVNNTKTDDEIFEMFNQHIYELKDPHTRFFYKVCPVYIIPESLYFDHGVLWYYQENKYIKVVSVNFVNIEQLLQEYQKKLSGYPSALIEDEIIKDIQLLQCKFKGDHITLECEWGEKVCLYPVLFNQWLENIHSETPNKGLDPIYIDRIDQQTICIRILSFRVHELYEYLKEKIKVYNGEYSTVIFDIRNNIGGYVEETKQIVRGIIKNKVDLGYSISYIKEGNIIESRCEIAPDTERLFNNKRFFVFVNYRTMSAAEYIFAKALQQDGVCIVGEESAGLKDQAEVFAIDKDLLMQITTKRFLKNGKYLQEKVVPDISINSVATYPKTQDPYIVWYKQFVA